MQNFSLSKSSGVFLAYNGENLKTWLGPADLKRKKTKQKANKNNSKVGF